MAPGAIPLRLLLALGEGLLAVSLGDMLGIVGEGAVLLVALTLPDLVVARCWLSMFVLLVLAAASPAFTWCSRGIGGCRVRELTFVT